MSERQQVAAVVATAGRPDLLRACLPTVAAALGPGDELIVAELGASGAGPLLNDLGWPGGLVSVDRPGKSRQLNAALRRSGAPVVLFTDDDCRVPPGWVEAMTAPFADPGLAIAFGPVTGLTKVPGSTGVLSVAPGEAPLETWTYAHGASFAIRRQAVLDLGGFDERLGPGAPAHGEEHDLLLRLREAGWRAVVVDAPPVMHETWRGEHEQAANALVYERGSGAYIGCALRRSLRRGWPLLKHRVGYQRQLLRDQTPFGRPALRAFAGGLLYGLRQRPWSGSPDH